MARHIVAVAEPVAEGASALVAEAVEVEVEVEQTDSPPLSNKRFEQNASSYNDLKAFARLLKRKDVRETATAGGCEMREAESAKTPKQLESLSAHLRGSQSPLCELEVQDGELHIPIEYADAKQARIGLRPDLFQQGSVPVMLAHLVIRNVVAHEVAPATGDDKGSLSGLEYDDIAQEIRLSCSSGAALRVTVSSLDVSLLVSDDKIGDQTLSMYM